MNLHKIFLNFVRLKNNMSTGHSEEEGMLLSRIAEGDEEAFASLFHTWRDRLYYFTLKITNSPQQAEDLVQDVFVKLWLQRSDLEGIYNFQAWIYRVIKNQAISDLRRMSLETTILAQLRKETVSKGQLADEQLLHKQLQQKLKEAIEKLPPRQKQIYSMIRIEGLKQEEIASRLNLSISTVQNHMTEALRKLRMILGKDYSLITISLIWASLNN